MFTVTRNGKTFEELEAQINSSSIIRSYPGVHRTLYTDDVRFNFQDLDGGETKEEVYNKIDVFNSSGPVTKRSFAEYLTAETAFKAALVQKLTYEFEALQEAFDLGVRLRNVDNPGRVLTSLDIDQPNHEKYFNDLSKARNSAQVGLIEDHWVNVIEPLDRAEAQGRARKVAAKDGARSFVNGLDLGSLTQPQKDQLLVHMARMVFGLE